MILNWRDPWHPEGGGSELYVHQVVQRLVAGGDRVTVFTAAYENPLDENGPAHPALPRDVRDGVTYVRRGGHLTVYLWAALFLLTRRFGHVDRVLEVQNGMPFLATLFTRARVVVLVHHVHREQWPVVGPVLARIGWFHGMMSIFSPRSSETTMRTREPRGPTHAPTGSTPWACDSTAILAR